MYERFFGFLERPFDLTSNPKFLFLTPSHREALGNLEYAIAARTAVTLLIGDAGLGKTTLIKATLESRDERRRTIAYLNNPTLTRSEFMAFLAHAFGLSGQAALSKPALIRELEARLLAYRDAAITPGLIIDEAQALSDELLEEIRLLANIETATEKLLPIVLAGQPELAARLQQAELRQLKQRVALRCTLHPLTLNETASYIASRIRIAGGDAARVFTREAVMLVHDRSAGIPRTISVICHNALIGGFAANRSPVGADIVHEVCRDFELHGSAPSWNPEPIPDERQVAALPERPQSGRVQEQEPASEEPPHRELFASIGGSRRRASS